MQFELMIHSQIYVVAKNLPGICRGLKFDYVDRTIQEVKKMMYVVTCILYSELKMQSEKNIETL